jgi:hypothetical protein
MHYLGRPLPPADLPYQVCDVPDVKESDAVVPKDMTVSVLVFSAIAALLAIILIVFFHPVYRRMQAEQQQSVLTVVLDEERITDRENEHLIPRQAL